MVAEIMTASHQKAGVRIQGLTKAFDQQPVLREVNLEVAPGTTTCIIGPSGSGKSNSAAMRDPTRGADIRSDQDR